jgi:hypothetical protein
MVKLAFKPTDKPVDCLVSKKPDVNFNPFSLDQCSFVQKNVAQNQCIAVKDLVGLENSAYILKNWYTQRNTFTKFRFISYYLLFYLSKYFKFIHF